LPAVEGGFQPPGARAAICKLGTTTGTHAEAAGLEARLYGSQDGCRYWRCGCAARNQTGWAVFAF